MGGRRQTGFRGRLKGRRGLGGEPRAGRRLKPGHGVGREDRRQEPKGQHDSENVLAGWVGSGASESHVLQKTLLP